MLLRTVWLIPFQFTTRTFLISRYFIILRAVDAWHIFTQSESRKKVVKFEIWTLYIPQLVTCLSIIWISLVSNLVTVIIFGFWGLKAIFGWNLGWLCISILLCASFTLDSAIILSMRNLFQSSTICFVAIHLQQYWHPYWHSFTLTFTLTLNQHWLSHTHIDLYSLLVGLTMTVTLTLNYLWGACLGSSYRDAS